VKRNGGGKQKKGTDLSQKQGETWVNKEIGVRIRGGKTYLRSLFLPSGTVFSHFSRILQALSFIRMCTKYFNLLQR